MNNKENLLQALAEVRETLKDYNKFICLFSDDEGIKTLAELNLLIGKIQTLLKISEIKEVVHPENKALKQSNGLKIVKVRPCDKKYGNKTYIGFLIGEIALSSSVSIKNDKLLCDWAFYNPAIYVPELGATIYGMESWWSRIESKEELNQITDSDIQNVWYFKLMEDFLNKKSNV